MKTIRKILMLLGLPVLALAQTNILATTTLSAAVPAPLGGATSTTVTLASCTAVKAPSLVNGTQGSTLFTWLGEAMQVTAVPSTSPCLVNVMRGMFNPTKAFAHPSGELVFVGDPQGFSGAPVGTHPEGVCALGAINYYPDIHTLDGTLWGCRSDLVWGFAGPSLDAYGAIPNRTKVVTTYTATYWDYFIAVDTTSSAFTLTLPSAAAVPGKVYVIQDEGGDAGTHTLTVTTANGCASITTNYAACRVISNGTAWFAF